MGKLYREEDIIEALNDCEIDGSSYRRVRDAIEGIPCAYMERDCSGCMGPSYAPGDCERCIKIVRHEKA